MKCLVYGCENHDFQGRGIEVSTSDERDPEIYEHWICIPCWEALIKEPKQNLRHSQIFRNMLMVYELNAFEIEEK